MSTKQFYDLSEIKAGSYFNNFKTIIETPFYGNNVYEVETPAEAYKLAANAPGTVVTDMPIFGADKVGLPKDATVLVFNDGSVQGRCAASPAWMQMLCRRSFGMPFSIRKTRICSKLLHMLAFPPNSWLRHT